MNNREVAHSFAHGATSGRGSNFFIDGNTLYSYGRHFPVARHVTAPDGPCVLMTTRRYSNTTSTHQSYARQACSHLRVFSVDNVMADNKAQHKENLDKMRETYHCAVLTASRARKYADIALENAERIRNEANEYSKAFKLGIRIPEATPEKVRVRADRQRKAEAAARKKREAAAREKVREALQAWRRGESRYVGNHQGEPVRLRLINNDETVQTSMGAEFPADDARRVWPLIKRVRETGSASLAATAKYRYSMGAYRINEIRTDGAVRAGCHTVPFESSRELATDLGLE